MRIVLLLQEKGEWTKRYNPRDNTIFIDSEEPPEEGTEVRLDLIVCKGGPKVIFRGRVISRKLQSDVDQPTGCSIVLDRDEREKVSYLNGYVRGGLLNLRENRRLPIRLNVTYGGPTGPLTAVTRDINDEGMFIISQDPLPEDSELHIFIDVPSEVPGVSSPISLVGTVAHTVVVEDEDIPGMGIQFLMDSNTALAFSKAVDALEAVFLAGRLPDKYLV